MIRSPQSIDLNTSTYVAVTLGNIPIAQGFSVYVVDANLELVSFYFATDATGTDEAPAPPVGLSWDGRQPANETVLYAKATVDNSTLVFRPSEQ